MKELNQLRIFKTNRVSGYFRSGSCLNLKTLCWFLHVVTQFLRINYGGILLWISQWFLAANPISWSNSYMHYTMHKMSPCFVNLSMTAEIIFFWQTCHDTPHLSAQPALVTLHHSTYRLVANHWLWIAMGRFKTLNLKTHVYSLADVEFLV